MPSGPVLRPLGSATSPALRRGCAFEMCSLSSLPYSLQWRTTQQGKGGLLPQGKSHCCGFLRAVISAAGWCVGLVAEFPWQISARRECTHVSVLVDKLGFLVIEWFVYMFTSVLGSFPKVRQVDKCHLFFPSEAHVLAALQAPWARHHSCTFKTRAVSTSESCPRGPGVYLGWLRVWALPAQPSELPLLIILTLHSLPPWAGALFLSQGL